MAKTEPTRRVRILLRTTSPTRGAPPPRSKTMNAIRIETLAIAAGLTLAALAAPACAQAPDGADPQGVEEPAPAARAAETGGAALRIEQAERSLDVGRDLPAARAALEEVVRDATTPPEQRDQARLALSRALEAQGDHEAATVAVEALFAEHEDGARFPLGRDHRRRDRREGGLQRRARQR